MRTLGDFSTRAKRLGVIGGSVVLVVSLVANLALDSPSISLVVLYVSTVTQVCPSHWACSLMALTLGQLCFMFYWHGGGRAVALGLFLLFALMGARILQCNCARFSTGLTIPHSGCVHPDLHQLKPGIAVVGHRRSAPFDLHHSRRDCNPSG